MKSSPNPNSFLAPSEVIDFHAPPIANLAKSLSTDDTIETIRCCFEFVRDEI